MAVMALRVTEDGIVIPSATIEHLGYRPGSWAAVEVHPLPSSEELQDRALYYILHHLGDAVYVGEPVREEDGWRLPLKVKGRRGTYGHLFLSLLGEVVESRSTSAAELEEALRAPRARHPAAF